MICALLLAMLAAQDARPGERIVFLGDSITDQGGYLTLVADRLGGPVTINRGLNGGIASDILNGAEQWGDAQPSLGAVLETDHPTVCVIFLGINDLMQERAPGLEAFAENLRRIVDACHSAGARVVLGTPALAGELPAGRNEHDAAIASYAAAARRVAEESGAHFADVRGAVLTRLAQPHGEPAHAGLLTYDGIHMLPEGNALLAEVFAAAILTALEPALLPAPQQLRVEAGWTILNPAVKIGMDAGVDPGPATALADRLVNLLGARPAIVTDAKRGATGIRMELGSVGGEEAFILDTRSPEILLRGNSPRALAWASAAMLQLAERTAAGVVLPRVLVEDEPALPWRGLLVDVARQFHPLEDLRAIVDLCSFYRLRWLVLHLTDDQSFTFASARYPRLATPGRSYPIAELCKLVSYAEARGVTLIPELEFPGHSTAMRRAMPELFDAVDPATGEWTDLGVINLGKPAAYEAYDALIGEIAGVFETSPYFHVGGDEAWLGRIHLAPETAPALAALGSNDVHDLFLDGLRRVHALVRARGLETLMWESFRAGAGLAPIPRDGLTMIAWETMYETPQNLLAAGYPLINASWKPLYVTPGPRFTDAETLRWNPWRWEHFVPHAPSFAPIQLEPTPQIRGGLFCSWEMAPAMELPALRPRLPIVAERLWSHARAPDADLLRRRAAADRAFAAAGSPLRVVAPELLGASAGIQPGREGWHRGGIAPRVWSTLPGSLIQLRLSGDADGASSLRAQALDAGGAPLGAAIIREYSCQPVIARVTGALPPAGPRNAWEEYVEFGQEARVHLTSPRPDWIVLCSLAGAAESPAGAEPVRVTSSGLLTARCVDAAGRQQGAPLSMELRHVDFESNLTTGRPVRASNFLPQFPPENAVDGRVDLERYWDASAGAPQWLEVDLEQAQRIGGLGLWTYWDGERSYQYVVDVSRDGKDWKRVADGSDNLLPAGEWGYRHLFAPQTARYVRVTMLKNSANPGLHVVELRVYPAD
jgi:hexosaminidase